MNPLSKLQAYHGYTRNDVIQLIGQQSLPRILDVGCGSGVFSSRIHSLYGSETWGIEPESESFEKSTENLTRALHGTFESTNQILPRHYFNAIFFNDVLEHMIDPQRCLEQAKYLLADEGKIYASLPNFIFADNVVQIVFNKDWRYEESGVLDKTHLRFFTRKSMIRLFSDAGYHVNKVTPLSKVETWKWKLLLNLSFNKLEEYAVYQYGIVASPC
jgi:2-polyprenyl-3-methyl-5-hydroxy-6-metoxy-1,4-benzoquinol methylase